MHTKMRKSHMTAHNKIEAKQSVSIIEEPDFEIFNYGFSKDKSPILHESNPVNNQRRMV